MRTGLEELLFELGGKKYTLDANENGNNLHSGYDFYNKRLWEVKQSDTKSITFAVFSPDGDQGYPGGCKNRGFLYFDGRE